MLFCKRGRERSKVGRGFGLLSKGEAFQGFAKIVLCRRSVGQIQRLHAARKKAASSTKYQCDFPTNVSPCFSPASQVKWCTPVPSTPLCSTLVRRRPQVQLSFFCLLSIRNLHETFENKTLKRDVDLCSCSFGALPALGVRFASSSTNFLA